MSKTNTVFSIEWNVGSCYLWLLCVFAPIPFLHRPLPPHLHPPSSTSLFHPPYHSVAFIYFRSEKKAEEISCQLEQLRSIASSPNRYSSSLPIAVVKAHSEIIKSNLDLLSSRSTEFSFLLRLPVYYWIRSLYLYSLY